MGESNRSCKKYTDLYGMLDFERNDCVISAFLILKSYI